MNMLKTIVCAAALASAIVPVRAEAITKQQAFIVAAEATIAEQRCGIKGQMEFAQLLIAMSGVDYDATIDSPQLALTVIVAVKEFNTKGALKWCAEYRQSIEGE